MPRLTYLFETILTTVKVFPKVQLGSSIQFLTLSSIPEFPHRLTLFTEQEETSQLGFFFFPFSLGSAVCDVLKREVVLYRINSTDERHLFTQSRVILFQNWEDFRIIISCAITYLVVLHRLWSSVSRTLFVKGLN
jgi:hypothetical protein